jgi:hypothetical protein
LSLVVSSRYLGTTSAKLITNRRLFVYCNCSDIKDVVCVVWELQTFNKSRYQFKPVSIH